MNKPLMNRHLFFATLAALCAILVFTSPVFAEGEIPEADAPPAEAPPAEPVETQPTESTETSLTEPAEEEPALPSPAETVEPTPTDPPPSEPMEATPVEEQTETAPLIETPPAEAAPIETEPIETEPMEAEITSFATDQEIVAQYTGFLGNVYFYDAGSGLHDNYTNIADAIAAFPGVGKGMIYVSDSGSAYTQALAITSIANLTGIVFLDYYPAEAAKYNADPFDPYDSSTWPEISNTVSIYDMPTFSLLGFRISSGDGTATVLVDNGSGTSGTLTFSYLDIENTSSGTALLVDEHTGAVKLKEVKANSTSGKGAQFGDGNPIAGSVTITNSSFNQNGSTGLEIYSTNLATLTGVSASYNAGDGSYLYTRGALIYNSVFSNNDSNAGNFGLHYLSNGTGNLTLENAQLNNNDAIGLYAQRVEGNVSLKNVRADENGSSGVHIDTCNWNGSACQNSGSGKITIISSQMEDNGNETVRHGLYIVGAKGSVTLTSVWVGNSGDDVTASGGAYIDNHYSPAASPITITDSGFIDNHFGGLHVISKGLITLKNVDVNNNQGTSFGALLINAQTGATAGISLLNSTGRSNYFNNNTASTAGLIINTHGSVIMNSTYANNTVGGFGVDISITASPSAAPVTINRGGFDNNTDGGLNVYSLGAITVNLTDGSASNNSGVGARGMKLENYDALTPKPVTVDGGAYNNNSGGGLEIQSDGVITVKNIEAGSNLNNNSGVSLNNSNSPVKASVTVTTTRRDYTSSFNSNTGYGLNINSAGSITLNRINADENNGNGAHLVNTQIGSTGGVTVTNSNFRTNNISAVGYGLSIQSYGNISIKSVESGNNGDSDTAGGGALIDNREVTNKPARTVTITNSNFNDNWSLGLDLSSYGKISLNAVQANSNLTEDGAHLYNHQSLTPQMVIVTNSNFDQNASDGLIIYSKGAVTLTNVDASDNHSSNGIVINNAFTGAVGGVSITCTTRNCELSHNAKGGAGDGLNISSVGVITLRGLHANNNNGNGALIDNSGSTALTPPVISITNCSFNDNGNGYGLQALSNGAITLTNTDAGNNTAYGAWLNNQTSPTHAGVTINGQGDWDWFGNNQDYGLQILTDGRVTVSKINANQNFETGLWIDTSGSGVTQTVSITNAEINQNMTEDATNDYSLYLHASGAVTLSNVWVNQSGDGDTPVNAAAYIHSDNSGITITNGYFNDSIGDVTLNGNGATMIAHGAVTIKNIQASNNSGYGVSVINQYAGVTGGVSLTRTGSFVNWISNNGDQGLDVTTNGTITIANLNAEENGNEVGESNATLNNTGDAVASTVKVSNSLFNGAGDSGVGDHGLHILAKGAVILTNVEASNNNLHGIFIENEQIAGQSVTLTNLDAFNNGDVGINVYSGGNVIARDLTTCGNSSYGANVYTTGNVTLTGVNYFNSNQDFGLYVEADGNINLANLTADRNVSQGIYASVNTASGKLTISNANANYNGVNGMYLNASNNILVNKVYALNNGAGGEGDGALIIQNSLTATVTVQNSAFHGNTNNGLEIDKNGAPDPIISKTTYYGNDSNGTGSTPDMYIHN